MSFVKKCLIEGEEGGIFHKFNTAVFKYNLFDIYMVMQRTNSCKIINIENFMYFFLCQSGDTVIVFVIYCGKLIYVTYGNCYVK